MLEEKRKILEDKLGFLIEGDEDFHEKEEVEGEIIEDPEK